MLDNYIRDGVWTLTTESYNDLLKQRYGTLGGACGRLGFRTPQEALSFSDNMQKELYAS